MRKNIAMGCLAQTFLILHIKVYVRQLQVFHMEQVTPGEALRREGRGAGTICWNHWQISL